MALFDDNVEKRWIWKGCLEGKSIEKQFQDRVRSRCSTKPTKLIFRKQNYVEKGKTEIRPSAFRENGQDDQEMIIVFIGITSKKERSIYNASPSTL